MTFQSSQRQTCSGVKSGIKIPCGLAAVSSGALSQILRRKKNSQKKASE